MATAAERTEIIQLVVGMVGAAPGADILTELEEVFDGGVTLEELAVAISENPAYSGDEGLFPDFLPNRIFARNFLTVLYGDELSEATMDAAIAMMEGRLNAGESRGELIYELITALADTSLTDADFGDAAQALANRTAVAEYYSVTVAQSSTDLEELMAVVEDVDSAETAVADGTDAVDNTIAENAGLTGLIETLNGANAAKRLFLVEADGDGRASTSTTEAAIGAALDAAQDATENIVGPGYVGGSDALQAALISDEMSVQALALRAANRALATAQGNAVLGTGTNSVSGLEASILADIAADRAATAAETARLLAENELGGSVDAFEATNTGTLLASGSNGAYTYNATPLINYSAATRTLSLARGVTEVTNPGVTALLAASQVNQAAILADTAADDAAALSQRVVENLDLDASGLAALTLTTAAMTVINPASNTRATVAEIDAELTGLRAIVASLDAVAATAAAADANNDANTHQLAIDALDAAIGALTFDTDRATTVAAHDALTAAAVTAGYLTAADKTAIDNAFATNTANGTTTDAAITDQATTAAARSDSQDALAENNASGREDEFIRLKGSSDAESAAANPLTDIYLAAAASVTTATEAIEALDEALVADAEAKAVADDLAAANKVIAEATAAFAPAGFEIPMDVDTVVEAATPDDDIFLGGGIDESQIISFRDDDVLFVGTDTVLNSATRAGTNGDDSVLEVWITGTSNAVITVETSVFGSSAVAPELYTITLTGVAAADLSYSDGFVVIV